MEQRQTRILDAYDPSWLPTIRTLFEAYEASLDTDLCFQEFDAELAGLPGAYAPPSGCIYLATVNDRPAGCVAMRRLDDATCEMKRLFVLPEFRGLHLGRKLVNQVIVRAIACRYKRMRLDTLPSMKQAIRMYESLGFVDIEPYYPNPVEGARFLELTF